MATTERRTAAPAPRPPGPPARRSLALMRRRMADPIGMFTDLQREHGNAATARLANVRMAQFVDPDAVQEVLVAKADAFRKGRMLEAARVFLGDGLLTSGAETHRRQRRLINPSFAHERLADYGSVMVAAADRAADAWELAGTIDLQRRASAMTLGIATETLFGREVPVDEAEIHRSLTAALDYVDLAPLPLSGLIMRLPTARRRRFERAKPVLDGLVAHIVEERRRSGERGEDLLQALLDARDEETGEPMDDAQIRDEVFTFAAAGHETTALAVTWTLWLLAAAPEAEARLHEELDRELGGEPPAVADLPRLPWTSQVLQEALRLRPPAWIIGRYATRDVTIGGWHVDAGTVVVTTSWLTHRHPGHWERPEAFDPERFAPGTERHRFAYYPFGGGTRKCIGSGFAMMEGALILATVCRRLRLARAPGAPDPGLKPQITLRPARPVTMVATPR